MEDNTFIVKDAGWNAVQSAGSTITLGYQLLFDIAVAPPKITSAQLEEVETDRILKC